MTEITEEDIKRDGLFKSIVKQGDLGFTREKMIEFENSKEYRRIVEEDEYGN